MDALVERLAKAAMQQADRNLDRHGWTSSHMVWETESERLRDDWRRIITAVLIEAEIAGYCLVPSLEDDAILDSSTSTDCSGTEESRMARE